eukprot:gene5051-biopygen2417
MGEVKGLLMVDLMAIPMDTQMAHLWEPVMDVLNEIWWVILMELPRVYLMDVKTGIRRESQMVSQMDTPMDFLKAFQTDSLKGYLKVWLMGMKTEVQMAFPRENSKVFQ